MLFVLAEISDKMPTFGETLLLSFALAAMSLGLVLFVSRWLIIVAIAFQVWLNVVSIGEAAEPHWSRVVAKSLGQHYFLYQVIAANLPFLLAAASYPIWKRANRSFRNKNNGQCLNQSERRTWPALKILGLLTLVWVGSMGCVLAVIPISDWAVGVGGGTIWLERTTAGDSTAPQASFRLEPQSPSFWFEHTLATNYENWSAPLWPAILALIVAFAIRRVSRSACPPHPTVV